jgi:phosphoribosylanthranilate isomerase
MNVKICGITRLEDANLAASLGAWALGFIFYRSSPRFIDPDSAAKIIDAIRAQKSHSPEFVGVFVNESASEVNRIAKESGLTRVQLHGDEGPDSCSKIEATLIKAIRPKALADIEKLSAFSSVQTFLIDAQVEGQFGGTGVLSNWELAKAAKKYGQVILSGGLHSENVAAAVREVRPSAVDVSSGVESKPGFKDAKKLTQFFKAVLS